MSKVGQSKLVFAPREYRLVLPSLIVLVVAGLVLSTMIGPQGFGLPQNPEAARLILMEIRLPRAILAALIGGALGLSGAALQGFLRNPLAEPGLIGVTGGAMLGAVLAIHSGLTGLFAFALPLGGLLGAGFATLLLLLLAGQRGGSLTLILAGVAISAVSAALTSLALNLSGNPFAAVEMVFWMMGSLVDRSMSHVWLAGPLILLGAILMLLAGRDLDALALGEDAAASLGVSLRRTRVAVVAGTALSVGAATAVAGAIGFVGLVVPHLLRPFVGHSPSRLLLASLLGGAVLVLAADIGLRLIAPYGQLRLGVFTAVLGAPFFVWLVMKTRHELGP